jgi:cell division protein FtsL
MRRGSGAIRIGIACALLFASLSLVVWRQGRALEELRVLDAARANRAVLEAERTQLQREIQRLESRWRILAVAGSRLGLRVPSAEEIVILQEPTGTLAEGVGTQESRGVLLTAAEQR